MSDSIINRRHLDFLVFEWLQAANLVDRPRYSEHSVDTFTATLDTAQAIASLQQSVERQGDALRSIAKHAMQTAKRVEFLERWDFDGLPKERGAA